MSDYIPTTEEIRRNNWLGTALRSSDHIRENAAFDRWLEQHDKEVAKATEERIIKLLEEEYAWFTSIEAGKLYNPIPEIVALIKGDN